LFLSALQLCQKAAQVGCKSIFCQSGSISHLLTANGAYGTESTGGVMTVGLEVVQAARKTSSNNTLLIR
jgi:hypothetical protein